MATQRNVIIFGATGDVGSAAALQAYQEGAKVSLAVRDPKKPIPRLSGIQFDKVPADLTKPETVEAAVRQTGATVAFIYVVGDGNMRPSLQALKAGGIKSIVFLSSFTIEDDIRAVPSTDFIAFRHAQVEIALEEVFGNENFVAIRPAYFSSNSLNFKEGILRGETELPNPVAEFDWISPADVGRVSGMILAHGSKENVIGLVGPEKLALKDAMSVIGDVLGKSINVIKIGEAKALKQMSDAGIPLPVANWMLDNAIRNPGASFRAPGYLEALGNVHKYTGKAPANFRQWMEENRDRFKA
ncbi:uncharacterized protein N7529_004258 [Penicillium soppii]|uniref:uncharacterized protein n=1 Tax=Penicillium soppii TaxID=69789 RepID=UPI0025475C04|nr:uncharacterized protein N7529_004258 [Penicillium soppii]KAJ5871905.1 hypothetical protein N7529_004258 [Penicillium soppii]